MSNKDNKLEPAERKRGASRTLFKDTLTRIGLADNAALHNKLCLQIWQIATDGSLPLSDRVPFIKMLQDRVDGRPAQSVEITDHTVDLPSAGQFKIVKVEPNQGE